MVIKSGVSNIFPHFKKFVETRLKKSIKTLYSNIGGEFIALKSYLLHHGITHYTTAPYTPQQNSVSERRHCHLVETGLTLLHDANLDFSYWPYAFQTSSYLINRQPTPLLKGKSPFEVLFGQPTNYLELKKFGCICYPLTRHLTLIKYNQNPKLVFFSVILKLRMHTNALTLKQKNYFSHATCCLMNITSTSTPLTLYPQYHHSQIGKLIIFCPYLMPS